MLTFKTAVIFTRAAADGGLSVRMMPGVFETAAALADGLKTYKALTVDVLPSFPAVFVPVDVTVDEKRNPVNVTPITLD